MLSVLVPGIRPQNWPRLLDSVQNSFSQEFEIIFVGPKPNDFLTTDRRCRFIQDYGSPARGQQIALLFAQYPWCIAGADDGIFLPGMLDKLFAERLYNGVITAMYVEGSGENMQEESYYKIVAAPAQRCLLVNPNWYVFNVALFPTGKIRQYGGWNAKNYEGTSIAHIDLAVRMQMEGVPVKLFKEQVLKCDHEPGRSGTHFAVHDAHTQHDEPRFQQIYNTTYPSPLTYISLDNWQLSPPVWKRRF